MSARAPRLLLPFVVAAYIGLLAPLVVVIAVSFGPSAAFEFPPRGLTLHWFEAFFASKAFVTAFFRVSLLVGLLSAALATALGTSAALGLVRFRFFGREALEAFFLAPLLVPGARHAEREQNRGPDLAHRAACGLGSALVGGEVGRRRDDSDARP